MPKIEARVSWGNIMVMATILVSVAVGWGVLTTTVAGVKEDISELRNLQGRVRTLEQAQAVTNKSLITIEDGIDELKREQMKTNDLIRSLLQQRH